MDKSQAATLARNLMDAAGLQGWSFRFDSARRRAGSCRHQTRTITLSATLTDLYEESTVRAVILHEIAHAIVGAHHHHDAVWQRQARLLGAPPTAKLPSSLPAPAEPWVGTCPRCGATRRLFRAPQRVRSCGECSPVFDAALILNWTYKGQPTTPGGAYAKELARLQRTWGLS